MIYDICTRCHRPIIRDGQVCWKAATFRPCVPRSDKTVIRVDGLLIKTGNEANPVPIYEDPYE